MIKILEVVSSLHCGGVEKILLDYTREIKDSCHMDIVAFAEQQGLLETEFAALGCGIYKATMLKKNPFQTVRDLNKIIKAGNYDVIHCHQGYLSFIALTVARIQRIPVRIAHSHLAFVAEGLSKKVMRKFMAWLTKQSATHLFACGIDAGSWAWGKKSMNSGHVHIMKNAIDISAFSYDPQVREKKRKELHIEDKFVIGNVGRMSYQKNHEFLLRVFARIYKKCSNAVLLLVGDGERMEKITALAETMHISDRVIFLGSRNDVRQLLNAMDVFVLPSHFEGLPITLVEAQCNGLKCYTSDNVTREVAVGDLVRYLSIDHTEDLWAEHILDEHERMEPELAVSMIKKGGYDINEESTSLLGIYMGG